MPSLNLDLDYFDHPKTKRLIGLLGRGAEVLPPRLWCYCGRYHKRDGSLADYSPQEIETLAGWWGASGKALEALVKVGFVDATPSGYRIHDWQEHAGHLEAYHEAAKLAAKARWSKRAPPPPDPKPPCDPQSAAQCEPHAIRNAPAVHGSSVPIEPPLTPPDGGEPSGSPKSGLRPREAARRAKAEAIGGGRTRRRATDPEAPPWVQDLAGRTRAGQGLTDAEGEALGRWLEGDDVADPRKGKAA